MAKVSVCASLLMLLAAMTSLTPAQPLCGVVCAIACPHGNVLDDRGCPTCQCLERCPSPWYAYPCFNKGYKTCRPLVSKNKGDNCGRNELCCLTGCGYKCINRVPESLLA